MRCHCARTRESLSHDGSGRHWILTQLNFCQQHKRKNNMSKTRNAKKQVKKAPLTSKKQKKAAKRAKK
jgi:hypothetical protein